MLPLALSPSQLSSRLLCSSHHHLLPSNTHPPPNCTHTHTIHKFINSLSISPNGHIVSYDFFSLFPRCNYNFFSHHSKHTQETNTHAGGGKCVYIPFAPDGLALHAVHLPFSHALAPPVHSPKQKTSKSHSPTVRYLSRVFSLHTHTHTQAAFRSHHEYHSALDHHHFHAEQSHTHTLSLSL